MSHALAMSGIEGLPPPAGLPVVPFGTLGSTGGVESAPSDFWCNVWSNWAGSLQRSSAVSSPLDGVMSFSESSACRVLNPCVRGSNPWRPNDLRQRVVTQNRKHPWGDLRFLCFPSTGSPDTSAPHKMPSANGYSTASQAIAPSARCTRSRGRWHDTNRPRIGPMCRPL